MLSRLHPILSRTLLLIGLGILVGFTNNLLANASRHLDWFTDYPDLNQPGPASEPPAPTPDARTSTEAATLVESSQGRLAIPPTLPLEGSATSASAESEPPHAAPSISLPGPAPDRPGVEVTPRQARAFHELGAIFVDARRTKQFIEGHISGAESISVWESGVDEKIESLLDRLEGDLEAPIVVYCNGGDCEDSHMLAEHLWNHNLTHVLVYMDGYPDWLSQRLPIEEGTAL